MSYLLGVVDIIQLCLRHKGWPADFDFLDLPYQPTKLIHPAEGRLLSFFSTLTGMIIMVRCYFAGDPDRPLASAEISAYGAASKFLAAVSTYPTQVIRSRLQQRFEGRSLVYNSTWQAVALTWQREGLGGFYKGLMPSLLRVMPQSAITLMVYEGVVQLIDNWDQQKPSEEQQDTTQQQQQQQEQWQQRQQQQHSKVQGRQQQQQRQQLSLTDVMSPLVLAADSQAEQ
jgi:hypothetical protein